MVSPADRRAAVGRAQRACRVSERRACQALVVHRSVIRYVAHGAEHQPVRARLRELAAGRARGVLLQVLQCDNGTEFTSLALDAWAHWQGVALDDSRLGKPADNCVCEAFNGSVRRACLSHHGFASLAEAQVVLDAWRQDYNEHRPHTTLGLQPPAVYRRSGHYVPRAVRAIN